MPSVTQSEIIAGLRESGVLPGMRMLLHSSLSSIGYVEGGADAVIDAILEVLGPGGTLLVPTLTGSEDLSPANPPIFDPTNTPCWTGRIPETLRARPGAIRSLHPTHSVAAIGAQAIDLTADHARSVTPCDEFSPYGKLANLPGSYIMLLGVSHQSNTTFHHVEEFAGVEYHIQPGFVQARIVRNGEQTRRHVMLHRYGYARDFTRMEPLFVERGIQRNGRIGSADVRLIDAPGMFATTLAALRADKTILLA